LWADLGLLAHGPLLVAIIPISPVVFAHLAVRAPRRPPRSHSDSTKDAVKGRPALGLVWSSGGGCARCDFPSAHYIAYCSSCRFPLNTANA
jgi:hypothetical protein